MKKILSRVAAGSAASLGIVAGLAGPAAAAGNSTQGPNSPIWTSSHTSHYTKVRNNNNVNAANYNSQYARSGSTHVFNNTTTGHASTGSASNSNSLSASVSVNNSGSSSKALSTNNGGGSSSGTNSTHGPNSPIKSYSSYRETTKVTNNNNLSVTNENYQTAKSGSAYAANNTTVGNVSSGNASNTNTTSINMNVTN